MLLNACVLKKVTKCCYAAAAALLLAASALLLLLRLCCDGPCERWLVVLGCAAGGDG